MKPTDVDYLVGNRWEEGQDKPTTYVSKKVTFKIQHDNEEEEEQADDTPYSF